ncbi:hypothetical protein N0V85_003505 [Neurospora sp. IMI 360204]|nr:hypothetical protein N0V85_003505 [Neurospora sp. IMI 360204]
MSSPGTSSKKPKKPLFILPKSHFDKVAASSSGETLLSKRPPTPYYPPSRQLGENPEAKPKDDQHTDQKQQQQQQQK